MSQNERKGRLGGFLLLAMSSASIGLAGCAESPSENVEIEGLPYSFPRSDVDRVVLPKDGMLYVRLNESPLHYILILDSMVDRAELKRGEPLVASLNYNRLANTEVVDSAGGPVICRDRPGLNCGFRLDDSGIRWSVLFNRNDVEKVPGIRKSALKQLQGYRGE